MAMRKWAQSAVKNPGGLHRALGIAENKTIPYAKKVAAAHSKDPKLRRMGQLALRFAAMSHKRSA